jgi:hypothetical protein
VLVFILVLKVTLTVAFNATLVAAETGVVELTDGTVANAGEPKAARRRNEMIVMDNDFIWTPPQT